MDLETVVGVDGRVVTVKARDERDAVMLGGGQGVPGDPAEMGVYQRRLHGRDRLVQPPPLSSPPGQPQRPTTLAGGWA